MLQHEKGGLCRACDFRLSHELRSEKDRCNADLLRGKGVRGRDARRIPACRHCGRVKHGKYRYRIQNNSQPCAAVPPGFLPPVICALPDGRDFRYGRRRSGEADGRRLRVRGEAGYGCGFRAGDRLPDQAARDLPGWLYVRAGAAQPAQIGSPIIPEDQYAAAANGSASENRRTACRISRFGQTGISGR